MMKADLKRLGASGAFLNRAPPFLPVAAPGVGDPPELTGGNLKLAMLAIGGIMGCWAG